MAINAGDPPETLVRDPLNPPTTMPPTIPATIPENSGARAAKGTPRQSGNATRKTTTPAIRSDRKYSGIKPRFRISREP